MQNEFDYDVIVVGGGHAGTEAALAAARTGASTLLITHALDTLGQMSCNPAIGGIGKGHLVKEIDALGGVMGQAADAAGIQFRTLNARKGPAVRATRAQCDRNLYKTAIRRRLESQPNLRVFQQAVDDLIVKDGRVTGVTTQMGIAFHARAVVLTVGTFLGGKIHIGLYNFKGGRAGEAPSNALARRLRALPFTVDRLKTGTPPRIDGRSVDFSGLEEQPGDTPKPQFSYISEGEAQPRQVSCWITHTSERCHEIIRGALDRSPMYSGEIESVGPRYCPSIEDKVVRFADKASHQIFIEPEGLDTFELYPNGISTSLPFDVQQALVHAIPGFENAHITRPGYAIEYDFFDPRDLRPSLETKPLAGLYFAGQINGTTGYEEAAAQGLIAGLNAARAAGGDSSWTPRRDEGYIGVMIDDLITQGTLEPYRMFTSRAEYRLQLREDNADLRLTEKGRELGLVDDKRWLDFRNKRDAVKGEQERLGAMWLSPNNALGLEFTRTTGITLSQEARAIDMLRRPDLDYRTLAGVAGIAPGVDDAKVAEQVEIQAKYAGYLKRQQDEIARQQRLENQGLDINFDYDSVRGLSAEATEKLSRIRPTSIGEASRIPGITPAAISLLLVHLKRRGQFRKSA